MSVWGLGRSGVPGDAVGGEGGGEVVLVDVGVLVGVGVVVGAREGEVGQGGGFAVGPVTDVVGIAPVQGAAGIRGRCRLCL